MGAQVFSPHPASSVLAFVQEMRAVFLVLVSFFHVGTAMFPLAFLANQDVWQAGEPTSVNIDYDVPYYGLKQEVETLGEASVLEAQVQMRAKVVDESHR